MTTATKQVKLSDAQVARWENVAAKRETTATIGDTIRIERTMIWGSRQVVYSVWEPYSGHQEQKTIDGKTWGRIGSRQLPAHIDRLEGGALRMEAISDWYYDQWYEAYAVILDTYSEAGKNCTAAYGEVSKDE